MNKLTVMDGSGDTEFKWNPDDPVEVEIMRETVRRLKAAGYSFWLVDGRPADEVTPGTGTLVVRRIDPDAVTTVEAPAPVTEAPARGRGRPRRTATPPASTAAGTEVVAHRPLRGG